MLLVLDMKQCFVHVVSIYDFRMSLNSGLSWLPVMKTQFVQWIIYYCFPVLKLF